MSTTSIEWTDVTWNPVVGCTRVSAGCDNCYAVKQSFRNGEMGHPKYKGLTVLNPKGGRHFNGVVRTVEAALPIPLKRKKPTKYFVNSMSDLFHRDVPFDFIDRVFGMMAQTPHHTFQVLTKRPERMTEYLSAPREELAQRWHEGIKWVIGYDHPDRRAVNPCDVPLGNVWLGTSVEHQQAADERIPHLLRCPAAVRFLSAEPLLGPLEFSDVTKRSDAVSQLGKKALNGIDWVIVGGESGPGARPMHPDWARSIRDQCQAAVVAFFFKQWGHWHTGADGLRDATWDNRINRGVCPCGSLHDMFTAAAGTHRMRDRCGLTPMSMYGVGKKAAGRLLDGREWNEFPEPVHANA